MGWGLRWKPGDPASYPQHAVDDRYHIQGVDRAIAVDVGGRQRLNPQHGVDCGHHVERVDLAIAVDITVDDKCISSNCTNCVFRKNYLCACAEEACG